MTKVRGFSLIELVLAFGILAMLAVTTTVILSSTLRSSARSSVSAKVRNEGEYLMESISQLMRYSPEVKCIPVPPPDPPTLSIYTASYLPRALIFCDNSNELIASNSGVANARLQISSNEVVVSGCAFTCYDVNGVQNGPNPPVKVNISFSVRDADDLIDPLIFDTDIILRNTQ